MLKCWEREVTTGRALVILALFIALSSVSGAQTVADSILWFHPNQEVRVAGLPSLTASSPSSSAALTTALEIVLHDETACCGKDSALAGAALSEPRSLRELNDKLQERRWSKPPVMVRARYLPENSINSDAIMRALLDQHALIMEWKSHFYIVYGAVFNETRYHSGARQYAIVKLLLLDPRFSDQRRMTSFNRQTDDLAAVQGILALAVTQQ